MVGKVWERTTERAVRVRYPGALLQVRVKVGISAADPPWFDGGAPTSVSGPITGRIDADTGCVHLAGSFTTPYCFWEQRI
jgi:hypothetical protein